MDVILGIAVGLIALWAILLVLFWALRPKNVSVRELLGLIPDVLRLLRSVIGDRSAPLDVRIVLVGLVAWILSPIDLIPEFIPVLGPLDDVVVPWSRCATCAVASESRTCAGGGRERTMASPC